MGPDSDVTPPQRLPCWLDEWTARRETTRRTPQVGDSEKDADEEAIEPPGVFLSVVVPAYNEESRLPAMLDEAVAYLAREHSKDALPMANGGVHASSSKANGVAKRGRQQQQQQQQQQTQQKELQGWEILIVSDGSTDQTVEVALGLAGGRHRHHRPRESDPSRSSESSSPPAKLAGLNSNGTVRVVSLEHNRGKGGAVTHGMRHVRGQYVLFADADGASTFSDLSKLMDACRAIADKRGRAVAIGSRAHLVGSEAVVKVGGAPFN